ncbi:hypothetical protein HanRHA438_Chr01g0006291 [Helianthus annuus]|nr:hypothetical protein HanRHA438_Chr01g0006291 [Helianthus annuus]
MSKLESNKVILNVSVACLKYLWTCLGFNNLRILVKESNVNCCILKEDRCKYVDFAYEFDY